MKRKVLGIILCLAMVSTLFVGCSSKESKPTDTPATTKDTVTEAPAAEKPAAEESYKVL
jgi:uncharacterized secreted protein with C-terminal beta-propeller domain